MPNFISLATSIAELACGDKLHTQSITHSVTHSPSLFDAPGTEAYALEKIFTAWSIVEYLKTRLVPKHKLWFPEHQISWVSD